MENFLYTSHDIRFKQPFGAVRENETITINFYVSDEFAHDAVRLSIFDDQKLIETYDMKPADKNGFDKYTIDFNIAYAGLYFYNFEIFNNDECFVIGRVNKIPSLKSGEKWQLTVYKKDFETPSAFYGKIMYQIFPDRFCKGNLKKAPQYRQKRKIHSAWNEAPESFADNEKYDATDFFEGNFDGIIKMLPFLKSLKVDIIYLNPIFESASNHRYNTGDYMKTDSMLGDEEDFKRLCSECSKVDIKIILDGVFSHTGSDSIYFNKEQHYDNLGAYQSPSSLFFPWYRFKSFPDIYDCWWGFPTLPNVNETNPEYLDFITNTKSGVLQKWQKSGASGWRLDVADELPDLFLETLRKSVKEIDSEALIIGEVWEDASNKKSYGERRKFLLGEQLDTVMNYPFLNAILNFAVYKDADLFWNNILPVLENYPLPTINCLMNSLSTHDTVRALTMLSEIKDIPLKNQSDYILPEEAYFLAVERFKLASFLQFTLPGIPCIYYGDEAGLYGFRDPFNRMPYPFGKEDKNLLKFFKELTAFRNSQQADFKESFELVACQGSVFSFYRGKTLCCINMGERTESLEIRESPILVYGLRGYIENGKIILPPMSFGAFQLK